MPSSKSVHMHPISQTEAMHSRVAKGEGTDSQQALSMLRAKSVKSTGCHTCQGPAVTLMQLQSHKEAQH